MSLTSRKPRPLKRTTTNLRDTRLVIIATEGCCTERQYFEIFGEMNSRVQIIILNTEEGMSAPVHVLSRLKKFKNDYELTQDDFLCLVIDKDRWPDAQLSEVAAKAHQLHFELAVSNPCFELWLYLHLNDLPPNVARYTCAELDNLIKGILGSYNRSNIQKDQFQPFISNAVQRAIRLDLNPNDRWPNQVSTRVYRIVQIINSVFGNT